MNEDIADDMRILEHEFTHAAADDALAFLAHTVSTPTKDYDLASEFAILNNMKMLKGYLLRRAALANQSETAVASFCAFMMKEAWLYD